MATARREGNNVTPATLMKLMQAAWRAGGRQLLNSPGLSRLYVDSMVRMLLVPKHELPGDPRGLELEQTLASIPVQQELAYRLALRGISRYCRKDEWWNRRVAYLICMIGFLDVQLRKVDHRRLKWVLNESSRLRRELMQHELVEG
jgi:hypothetical protein